MDMRPKAKGKALSRSTFCPESGWAMGPGSCPHQEMSGQRGNQSQKWMTCQRCGSRWAAIWSPEQAEIVVNRVKNGEPELIGMHDNTVRSMAQSLSMNMVGEYQMCRAVYQSMVQQGLTPQQALSCMANTDDNAADLKEIQAFIRAKTEWLMQQNGNPNQNF